MMRFDRFTERAQEDAQRAAEIIQRYGHNQIDTEHILLALIEQPQGEPATAATYETPLHKHGLLTLLIK